MKILNLILAASVGLAASAADKVDYLNCDFTDGMPFGFTAVDNDGAELSFLMYQAGFEQGQSWIPYVWGGAACVASPGLNDDPEIAADDWLVTPVTYIRGGNASLSFRAASINEQSKRKSSFRIMVCENEPCLPSASSAVELVAATQVPYNTWTNFSFDLSAYAGKHISLAIINCSDMENEVLAIDDLVVEGEPGLAMVEYLPGRYSLGGEPFIPGIRVTATSEQPITSLELSCLLGEQTLTAKAEGLNIAQGESTELHLTEPLTLELGQEATYLLDATVNGQAFDTKLCNTKALYFLPTRKVVLEEITGTWCGWCTKAIVATDSLKMAYGDQIIPIAIHTGGDPMAMDDYTTFLGHPGDAPTGLFNRSLFCGDPLVEIAVDRGRRYTMSSGGFGTYMQRALAEPTEAEVAVTAKLSGTRYIKVDSEFRFALNVDNANYNVATIIAESGVTGAAADGYVQSNYLSNYAAYGPIGGYEHKPDYILDMKFQHVARMATGNKYEGHSGIIPTSVEAGKTYTHSETISVPSGVNSKNCAVVVMLIDNNTGKVVNAAEHSFYVEESSIDELSTINHQPSTLFDLQGRPVLSPRSGLYIQSGRLIRF